MLNAQAPLVYPVKATLGVVVVTLDRRGMGLGERGGFEARWALQDELSGQEVLSLESYRRLAKAHLKEVYSAQEKGEPPNIALNLASHQLIDDIAGWTKLNAPASS